MISEMGAVENGYFYATGKETFLDTRSIVSISGFSQGMLLPLISSIFERDGVSSALNGLNATGLYIGTLLVSPFMEAPLRRFGYKPIIVGGGMLVFVSLLLFPLMEKYCFLVHIKIVYWHW